MTGSIRLYVDGSRWPRATTIAATAAQAHYLAHVMRRGPGDTLRLFNGRDGEFAARIETVRRDRASLAGRAPDARPEPMGPICGWRSRC